LLAFFLRFYRISDLPIISGQHGRSEPRSTPAPHDVAFQYFNSETANLVLDYSIKNQKIKNSFQAQEKMPEFVLKNLHLIEPILIKSFIDQFPKPGKFLIEKHQIEYN
jgi:hypothetical protein